MVTLVAALLWAGSHLHPVDFHYYRKKDLTTHRHSMLINIAGDAGRIRLDYQSFHPWVLIRRLAEPAEGFQIEGLPGWSHDSWSYGFTFRSQSEPPDQTEYRLQGLGVDFSRNRSGSHIEVVHAALPLLPPTLVLAAASAYLLLTSRPKSPDLCPACGYDLRHSPTRCPECGLDRPPTRNATGLERPR